MNLCNFTKKATCVFALLAVYLSFGFAQEGFQIDVRIPNLKDTSVIVGHYMGKLLYPDDTFRLDKKGHGIFKGKKPLPQGLYVFVLPSKTYFEVLIGHNQKFSLEADTADFLKTVKFKNSLDNQLFYVYQNQVSTAREKANMLTAKKKTASTKQQNDSISQALEKINHEMDSYVKTLLKSNPNLIFTTFLRALQDIEIPDPPRDDKGNVLDSAFQFRYYRQHYFDNFDFADGRLLRTPFYEQKIMTYLERFVPQIADSLMTEVDGILEKTRTDSAVFSYVLGTLYNHYASSQIVGMDAVFVHIAEKYYIPYATWSTSDYMDKLKKEISKVKPNLIGRTAPDLELVEIPTDMFMASGADTALKSNPNVGKYLRLHNIQANYLVIVFWEADCRHCKKSVPQLYDSIYPKIKNKGVKVLAVHTITSIEGKRKWIDFVNEHKMYGFINAWSPLNSNFRDLYNVYSNPSIFMLDKNKKIIAKRIGVEQIEEVLDLEELRTRAK